MVAKGTTQVRRGPGMGMASTSRFAGSTLGPASTSIILAPVREHILGFQAAFVAIGLVGLIGALIAHLSGRKPSTCMSYGREYGLVKSENR